MITISLGGKEIVIRPKTLLDYVEKLDFIKSRRTTPFELVKDFPQDRGPKGAEGQIKLVQIAMQTVYTRSSSVSYQEEIDFDASEEGYYYDLWRCFRKDGDKNWVQGINAAREMWEGATQEERLSVKYAFVGIDETNNLKNSDGPSDSNQSPGQENPSA
jgi:hypothetical protein